MVIFLIIMCLIVIGLGLYYYDYIDFDWFDTELDDKKVTRASMATNTVITNQGEEVTTEETLVSGSVTFDINPIDFHEKEDYFIDMIKNVSGASKIEINEIQEGSSIVNYTATFESTSLVTTIDRAIEKLSDVKTMKKAMQDISNVKQVQPAVLRSQKIHPKPPPKEPTTPKEPTKITCQPGYKLYSDDVCRPEPGCDSTTENDVMGNCECKSGYELYSDDVCRPDPGCDPTTENDVMGNCECKSGYVRTDSDVGEMSNKCIKNWEAEKYIKCGELLTNCVNQATYSKEKTGCMAYGQGYRAGNYTGSGQSTLNRDYTAGSYIECNKVCTDMYTNIRHREECKEGCKFMHKGKANMYCFNLFRDCTITPSFNPCQTR